MTSLLETITNKLKEGLPGIEAQYEMAPITRPKFDIAQMDEASYKKSAVMLLLCPNENGVYIPLTKRQSYNGKHSGQISLPGGKFEEGDGSLKNTALRECYEEIGIKQHIEVLGNLSPVYIPVSNFYVEPYVGIFTHNEINFNKNEREVEKLILLSIETLKQPELVKSGTIVSGDGYKLKTPYFDVEGEIIWGATAMILNEFKKLIT